MKRNNAQNSSAKKKLIPAVAMFTASAVMLSTATYAWFTMNRDVQVDGLQMTATTSSSLEISLGELGDDAITTPADTSTTWTKKIAVSDFYNTIGKLKPASSTDGNSLYMIKDENGIYAGGTKVEENADVVAVDTTKTATLTPGKTTKITQTENNSGYYIDVPMWIRSSNKEESEVYCTVTIVDGENGDDTDSGKELMKAVRVAVIPVASTTTAQNIPKSGDSNALVTNKVGTTTVFGLDSETYNNAVLNAVGKYNASTGTAGNIAKANDNDDNRTKVENTDVFTLPAATETTYGVESFIVRVWLEGESTSCNDLTANQDWNINFDFSLDKKTATTGN